MNKKSKIYSIILLTLICIFMNVIVILPLNKKLDELKLEKEEIMIESENTVYEYEEQNIRDSIMEKSAVYENKEIIEINNKLEKTVYIEYIEKNISENEKGIKKTNLNIRMKGSKENIFSAITSIEKMNTECKINSVEIERNTYNYNENKEKNNSKDDKKNSKNKNKDNNKKLNSYTCILNLEIV